ncbi:MAG: YojF family protein [Trueperaceae bacterium]|nr:YojF family protein [Trueperaceae bacterium]
MEPIDPSSVQEALDGLAGRDVYLHLETTTGTYSAMGPDPVPPCVAFVRNARIRYDRGAVRGDGPYRVGLKMDEGWVYGHGLTHAERPSPGRLLMAGYDDQGRLRMALQLSEAPFREGAA